MGRGSVFRPTQTGDQLLTDLQGDVRDTFQQLEEARRGLLVSPTAVFTGDAELSEELFVVYTGTAGATLKLPPASLRGPGRSQALYIMHGGLGKLIIRRSGSDTLNTGNIIRLNAGETVVLSSDGDTKWFTVLGQPRSASDQVWNAARYYSPALGSGSTNQGALIGAGDQLWGIAKRFGGGGTITAIVNYLGNPTSGAGESTCMLYRADAANPIQPTSLLHAFRCDGKGFNATYEETGLSIHVTAGDILWFVSFGTVTGVDVFNGGALNLQPQQIQSESDFGTIYDPTVPLGPSATIVALKHALTYTSTPPDPFPNLNAGTTDYVFRSTATAIPIFMYKFVPDSDIV